MSEKIFSPNLLPSPIFMTSLRLYSCRPHVDVQKVEGEPGSCGRLWTGGRGVKNLIFLWMSYMDDPYGETFTLMLQ